MNAAKDITRRSKQKAKAKDKDKSKGEVQSQVPVAVLEACRDSFKAAHEHRDEELTGPYDINGAMGMVCRHGAPLFFTNITTPGERQHYAVALVEHLFKYLPPNTILTVLYDIGCSLDHTLNIASILVFLIYALLTISLYPAPYSGSKITNPTLFCYDQDACIWSSDGLPNYFRTWKYIWHGVNRWRGY